MRSEKSILVRRIDINPDMVQGTTTGRVLEKLKCLSYPIQRRCERDVFCFICRGSDSAETRPTKCRRNVVTCVVCLLAVD